MKKIILFFGILCLLASCSKKDIMTEQEIELINSGAADMPMRVLTINNHEDSVFLRTPGINIDSSAIKGNKDLQMLIARMKVTMEKEEGIGIAAPQIGIGRNIFLFTRIHESDERVQVVINPKIIASSRELFCFERDGCLSIPDIYNNSIRHEWVDVEYYNEKGEKINERLMGGSRQSKDYSGVIFQHEFGHLKGALFIDMLCYRTTRNQI